MKHVSFTGRLVMLGCGSIGQGVLLLILRHTDIPRERTRILTADARGSDVAAKTSLCIGSPMASMLTAITSPSVLEIK